MSLRWGPTGVGWRAAPGAYPRSFRAGDSFSHEVAPLLRKYCVGCHGGDTPAAGLALSYYRDRASVLKARDVWEKVAHNVSLGRMPPPAGSQPTRSERELLVSWVEATLSQADCQIRDPGRVTMRRLNREEYNNTVRDLLGVSLRPADQFPSDDVGYGFDNIGDVLSISPLLMEKYVSAAEKLAQAAIVTPEGSSPVTRYEREGLAVFGGSERGKAEGRILETIGELGTDHDFTADGDYILKVRAFGQQAGREPVRMALRLDGKNVRVFTVTAMEREPGLYQVRVRVSTGSEGARERGSEGARERGSDRTGFPRSLTLSLSHSLTLSLSPLHLSAGKRRVAIAFLNAYSDRGSVDEPPRDRSLILQSLEIQGPMGLPADLPESHRRIFVAQPSAGGREVAARKIMAAFGRRAYRRPVTSSEVERLVRWVQLAAREGESFERGIQLAVQAALCSPHFLFRVETGAGPPTDGGGGYPSPQPPSPKRRGGHQIQLGVGSTRASSRQTPSPLRGGGRGRGNRPPSRPIQRLDGYALASRLSYFLWSSMPDDRLFRLAAAGRLGEPDVLAAEARRMLKDPRARELASNFGSQWLTLRRLSEVTPDPGRFPEFNDALRLAMREETERFFEAVVREDRSVLDFLDGRYTFLNEPLAKLYGIPGVKGNEFRRVALTGDKRRGILTQASVLIVTSNPTRTSPVKRGKWVMEQILGTPPPPPPPGVPELADEKKGPLKGTLRQRMEQHRKDPMCASCHTRMDAIGFGLENFDPIGRWRTRDGEYPVDSSGILPDGRRFRGPAQLIQVLKAQKTQFVRSLSEKMLTYALGRGLEAYDNCYVQEIARSVARNDCRFSALIAAVVQSPPFRERRGDGGRS